MATDYELVYRQLIEASRRLARYRRLQLADREHLGGPISIVGPTQRGPTVAGDLLPSRHRPTPVLGRTAWEPTPWRAVLGTDPGSKVVYRQWSLREIAHKVQKQYGVTITHMGVQGVLNREEAKSPPDRKSP